jgi:hypothetical protein
MTTATVRAAIYSVVNGVSGTGTVHDYKRWAPDWSTFLDRFKVTIDETDYIRGFDIMAGPVAESLEEHGAGTLRTHTFTVRMYYGWRDEDSSEKAAATLAESVMNALDADGTLHAFYYAERAQMPVLDARLFGNVMVHYAEIVQRVTEWAAV